MIVQWTSDIGGRRVCRGLFCPVQLISPKIIPPVEVGGGGVATQQCFIRGGFTPRPESLHVYRSEELVVFV